MTPANPGIHHFAIGDYTVTALNDGAFEAQTAWVAGVPAEECEALLRDSFRAVPPRITISAFLLSKGTDHTLIDSGCGTAMGPAFGNLRTHLKTLGIAPADIKRVLVTHAHIDHVCGLINEAGAAYYPNAEIVIHEAEPAYWLNPANEAAAPEGAKSGFHDARTSLTPYTRQTRTITDGATIIPGVTALHLPGHTPGHTGYKITSGTDSLLIWGDVVHLPGIQFARPEAAMGFDNNMDLGRISRRRAFDLATTERLRVAGMHLDFPCFGHVTRAGTGYSFVPEVWTPGASWG